MTRNLRLWMVALAWGIASPALAFDGLNFLSGGSTSNRNADPCREGSPYYQARQLGKDAYSERHNEDLLNVLVENRPELVSLYGKCVEALNSLDALKSLFNPSVYVNIISLEALKKLIFERVVDAVCEEAQEGVEELYGLIADVIPLGEYVYELDEVFDINVEIGQ